MNVWNYKNLLKNYSNKNFQFERVEDKEDFIEDVLLKVHSKLHLFNKDKSKIFTWIVNVATRHYIDKYIRKKRVILNYEGYISNQETSTTMNSTIDLDLFEESIKDHPLYEFYLLRKQDVSKEDIIFTLNITTKEFNLKLKELRELYENFRGEEL
jgi:DNA-directed RNA polymerase specialized sigma24 family protein